MMHDQQSLAENRLGDKGALVHASDTPTGSTASDMSPRELCICRFCLDGDDCDSDDNGIGCSRTTGFVQPCPCRGTAKFVHMSCLKQHFVAQADWHNFKCPTCKQPYEGQALLELATLSRDRMVELHGLAAPRVAHSLCYLAQAHAQLGNTRDCKELLEQGLDISEAHYGRDHVATAATLAELASAYGKLGNVLKQKELLERSLSIKEQHFGVGHINTAVTLNNLATAHSELGNIRQEQLLLERSLDIKEKYYGKGHVKTTAALVNLAGVYSELGDVQRGRQLLEWSLEIEQRHFGVGHVETAITLNNLALACGEEGNIQRMSELLTKSLRIKERHFGFDHPELCLTLTNLGMACAAMQDYDLAKAHCSSALRASSGPDANCSRRRGVVLLRSASVHLVVGEAATGHRLLAEATGMLQAALGPAASSRVLQLERTRMSRIWNSVGRADVIDLLPVVGIPSDVTDSEAAQRSSTLQGYNACAPDNAEVAVFASQITVHSVSI